MPEKISFKDDYSNGCHPMVADAIYAQSFHKSTPYSTDDFSEKAREAIRRHCKNKELNIYFACSGTQANTVMLANVLQSFESVICAESAHINNHEAGAIEATGHRLEAIPTSDGKLTPAHIQQVLDNCQDHHMTQPKAVYISNATEWGSSYSLHELEALREQCIQNQLYLVLDGARLGAGLAAQADLEMSDIARLVDVFYIGGAKNGIWLGDALIVNPKRVNDKVIHHLKQRGGLVPKGRLLGIQFYTLFQDYLYFDLAQLAYQKAQRLAAAFLELNYTFMLAPETNQIFPILNNSEIEQLQAHFAFYVWKKWNDTQSVIRLVCSWDTADEEIHTFIAALKRVSHAHRAKIHSAPKQE